MLGVGFKGRDMFKIADAVGRAVFLHVSTPNNTFAALSGVVGPVGTVNSVSPVVGVVPTAMGSFMKMAGLQNGFTGRDMSKLANAISLGVSQVLMTMLLSGAAVGVAIGGGTAKFVGLNPNVLSGLLKVNMASFGFTGRDMMKLASMIATGIVTHLMASATFPVLCTGVVAPIPPIGPLPIVAVPTVFSKIS